MDTDWEFSTTKAQRHEAETRASILLGRRQAPALRLGDATRLLVRVAGNLRLVGRGRPAPPFVTGGLRACPERSRRASPPYINGGCTVLRSLPSCDRSEGEHSRSTGFPALCGVVWMCHAQARARLGGVADGGHPAAGANRRVRLIAVAVVDEVSHRTTNAGIVP